MTERPRLMLCAPSSGSGKTTVTCALLRALKERGAAPAAFKCGPDYIDPMFHSEVVGVPSRNLDLFLMGEAPILRSLQENGGAISLIEAAMGYYDGIAMGDDASAYRLAQLTSTPAVLVIDGRGRALSAAALVKGFADFRPRSQLRGVIFNRVSPMLYPRLKELVERETGLRAYGFLPECPDCTIESRHLGLVTAAEIAGLQEKLDRLSALARQHLDIEGLTALSQTAPPLTVPPERLPAPVAGRPRIAVARDKAFCFYYADALRLLERLGAELAFFSPLADAALPEGTAGLYLGGGYPELHAEALSENRPLLQAIREAIQSGLPTIAECGGFLYLHEALTDAAGQSRPMAGLLHASARSVGKLTRFGYITMTAQTAGLLCPTGASLNAHEFHYWDSTAPGEAFHAQKPQSPRAWFCAHHTPTLYAGFPHVHLCGCPQAAGRFVEACMTRGNSEGLGVRSVGAP